MAPEYSESLTLCNSASPISDVSGLLSNCGVKTIHEIRSENLAAAVQLAGTQASLADKAGLSPAYISQVSRGLRDSKTGRARTLGDDAARAIEDALKLPRGWMDNDQEAASISREALVWGRYWDGLSPEDQQKLVTIADTVTGKPAPRDAIAQREKTARRVSTISAQIYSLDWFREHRPKA